MAANAGQNLQDISSWSIDISIENRATIRHHYKGAFPAF
jgi:hypothetical protein